MDPTVEHPGDIGQVVLGADGQWLRRHDLDYPSRPAGSGLRQARLGDVPDHSPGFDHRRRGEPVRDQQRGRVVGLHRCSPSASAVTII